jgi:hypothetical protein
MMFPEIIKVIPKENYLLLLIYGNGEVREFDLKPYLEFGIFRELRDKRLFHTVRTSFDSVIWENQADLDPEMLYQRSTPAEVVIK